MSTAVAVKTVRKYARVGELVKIVTPKEFVRCGYPLSIKDVMNQQFEEIEKDCTRMFAALEKKPLPTEQAAPAEEEIGFSFLALSVSEGSNMSATVHGMICAAAAAYRLEQQNFGGNQRIIVEQNSGPFEVGQTWRVAGKRLVKTGKRYPASCYREDDYEPGGLENEQTHCVYSVQRNGSKSKILAAHCEVTK